MLPVCRPPLAVWARGLRRGPEFLWECLFSSVSVFVPLSAWGTWASHHLHCSEQSQGPLGPQVGQWVAWGCWAWLSSSGHFHPPLQVSGSRRPRYPPIFQVRRCTRSEKLV